MMTTGAASGSDVKGGSVATLGIDLQEGFANDTVVLRVNGNEVFQGDDVTTKRLIGLARSLVTTVQKGAIQVEIVVPTRNTKIVIPLEVSADTYIGASIRNGKMTYIVSNQPFGYG
jgi:hypothetical protein